MPCESLNTMWTNFTKCFREIARLAASTAQESAWLKENENDKNWSATCEDWRDDASNLQDEVLLMRRQTLRSLSPLLLFWSFRNENMSISPEIDTVASYHSWQPFVSPLSKLPAMRDFEQDTKMLSRNCACSCPAWARVPAREGENWLKLIRVLLGEASRLENRCNKYVGYLWDHKIWSDTYETTKFSAIFGIFSFSEAL